MIGLLTYHQCHNYGAVLQAYALQNYLKNNGYDSEYINITNKTIEWHGKKAGHIAYRDPELYTDKYNERFRDKLRKRWEIFETFIHEELDHSELATDEAEVNRLVVKYERLIVGGDQLWNPNIPVSLDVYALPFNIKSPKYSYGTSIGDGRNISLRKRMFLRQFERIGIREFAWAPYIEKYTGIKAVQNLDPVFLLEKEYWQKFENKPDISNYIFAYLFHNGREDFTKRVQELINGCQQLGKTLIICANDLVAEVEGVISLVDLSPREWLGYIDGADFVVTNSFHGMAFSLIYEKQFIVLDKDARKEELLKIAGIEIKADEKMSSLWTKQYEAVQYEGVSKRIAAERIHSREYLNEICEV